MRLPISQKNATLLKRSIAVTVAYSAFALVLSLTIHMLGIPVDSVMDKMMWFSGAAFIVLIYESERRQWFGEIGQRPKGIK